MICYSLDKLFTWNYFYFCGMLRTNVCVRLLTQTTSIKSITKINLVLRTFKPSNAVRNFTDCIDCEVAWGEWGECSNDQRSRSEIISTKPVGAGAQCPPLRTESERT